MHDSGVIPFTASCTARGCVMSVPRDERYQARRHEAARPPHGPACARRAPLGHMQQKQGRTAVSAQQHHISTAAVYQQRCSCAVTSSSSQGASDGSCNLSSAARLLGQAQFIHKPVRVPSRDAPCRYDRLQAGCCAPSVGSHAHWRVGGVCMLARRRLKPARLHNRTQPAEPASCGTASSTSCRAIVYASNPLSSSPSPALPLPCGTCPQLHSTPPCSPLAPPSSRHP